MIRYLKSYPLWGYQLQKYITKAARSTAKGKENAPSLAEFYGRKQLVMTGFLLVNRRVKMAL